jgi:allophanate hydrolase subunit 2
VLPGPASSAGDPTFTALVDRAWYVAPESDRRGLRLEPAAGGSGHAGLAGAGELPSHGVLPGAIQLTPAGQPLVLLEDAGTTGGYPVVAVVIHADVPLLGQLGPGAEVRFRASSPAAARDAEQARRRLFHALASQPA